MWRSLGCLAFSACALMLAGGSYAAPADIDPELRATLERSPDAGAIFVLRTQPDADIVRAERQKFADDFPARAAVLRAIDDRCREARERFVVRLRRLGATDIREYRAVNAVAARIPSSALAALERDPELRSAGTDGTLQAQLDVSAQALGAQYFRGLGWTGAGQSIALIDSGVDSSHPAFAGAKIVHGPVFQDGWFSPNNDNANSPDDYSPNGHGTQMAGILVGQGSTGYRAHVGIAPGATLYNLKAAYATTSGGVPVVLLPFRAMLAALDYAVLQTPAKIINISYGQGAYSTSSSASAAALVDEIISAYDVAVVMGFPNALDPAGSLNAIVVGAMDDHNTVARADDTIAPASPSPGVMRYPDLTAPGVAIMAPTNAWEGPAPDYVAVPGPTVRGSPSAAAAHVSGALALLREMGITDMLLAKAVLINSTEGTARTAHGGWGYLDLWYAKDPGSYFPRPGLRPSVAYAFAGPVDSGPLRVTLTTTNYGSYYGSAYLVISDRRTGKRVFSGGTHSGPLKVSLPSGNYLIQVDNWSNGGRWALAISRRGFEPVAMPQTFDDFWGWKLDCHSNANVALGSSFAVTCALLNPWDVEAPEMTGKAFVHQDVGGETDLCTINFGTIPGHGSRTQSCFGTATRPGSQLVCVTFRQRSEYHEVDPEYGGSDMMCYPIQVTGAGIRGKVVMQGTGLPASDVAMTLGGPLQRMVKTNAAGEFAFYELRVGTGPYTITPSKTGYVFSPPSVTVARLDGSSVPSVWFTATPPGGGVSRQISANSLTVVWNSGIQVEAITGLFWKGGPNLTAAFSLDTCGPGSNGNVESFGQAMSPPDPQIGGKILAGAGTSPGTWVPSGSTGVEIQSIAQGCAWSTPGIPVVTKYNLGRAPNTMDVERTFRFDLVTFWGDLRPYVPRLRRDLGFTTVYYPGSNGTLARVSTRDCEFGCTGAQLPVPWLSSAGWYAMHDDVTGHGVVVTRSRANDTAAVQAQLWVDQDGGSYSNASSFLLKRATGRFGSSLTERMSFYFYDSTLWTPSLTPPQVYP